MKMPDGPLHAGGAQRRPVAGVRGGAAFAAPDWVAEERPVALEFNGVAHAVMLATPLDLEDFALGFSLSEGILGSADELYGVEIDDGAAGVTLRLRIATRRMAELQGRRRTLAGRTGCGLCGTESLAQLERPLPALPAAPAVARAAVARALGELRALQALQHATGAVHAAAWCGDDGAVRLLREDVGRHNALDKLIGAMATAGALAADGACTEGFFAVTSRASYEMLHKTAAARVRLLVAVSAATTMAVDLAERLGVGLAGFARGHDLVVYAGSERIDMTERSDGR